jgi:hypothetical protein
MLNNKQIKYRNNVTSPDSLLLDYVSEEIENKFRYESVYEFEDFKLQYGAGGEYARYTNSTYQKIFVGTELKELDYQSALDLFKYSAFIQATHSYLKDRLTLSLGGRVDGNTYSAEMTNALKQFSPRLSASYVLRENMNLNFSTGRFFQLPPYTTLGYRDAAGTLVNKENDLKYLQVDHLVLGVDFLPNPKAKISLEGFYKQYQDYPFSLNDSISLASKGVDFGTYGDEAVSSISEGRAFGMEILVRHRDLRGFNVIVAYTLVRSEFADYSGTYIPSSWDNKHLLNITVSKKLKKNWDIGAKWRFVGGAPYTPFDESTSSLVNAWNTRGRAYLDYNRFNELRLKSFHQLDIRVDKQYYFKKWSMMLYLDIQNLYNFKSDQQNFLVNTQADGSVQTFTDDQGNLRYKLRSIESESGTVLPTVGVMIEF